MVNSVLADNPPVSFADSLKGVRLPPAIGYGNRLATLRREPWRAAGCRPYGCGVFLGGSFAERVMRSIVVRLLSWRFT